MRILLVLALLLALSPAAAHAQDADIEARARQHYSRGETHYRLGEYDLAIAEYKEGYKLSPKPAFLFNIAQSMRLKGDCAGALRMYKNYLRDDPEAPNRAKVETWIAEMETCVKQAPKSPEPAAPEVTPPADEPAKPAPDPVTQPEAAPPDEPAADLTPAPSEPTEKSPVWRYAGYGSLAAGAILLGAGTYYAFEASSAESTVNDFYDAAVAADGAPLTPEVRDAMEDGESHATRARIFIGSGVALAAAGGILWWLGRPVEETTVTVSSSGVVVTGTF